MRRRRHGAEQIIAELREAEVELARGKTAGEVCRKLGVTEQTYYFKLVRNGLLSTPPGSRRRSETDGWRSPIGFTESTAAPS